MSIKEASYATRSVPLPQQSNSINAVPAIDNLTLLRIQYLTGLKFSVLLIDCEGCINSLFGAISDVQSLRSSLKGVTTIILEADMSIRDPLCEVLCVDYSFWISQFERIGFNTVYQEPDAKFSSIVHYVFHRYNSN